MPDPRYPPPHYWPDGRLLVQIQNRVEDGKAELRAAGVEPWPYDPAALPGWRAVTDDPADDAPGIWQGPPRVELVRAFLTSKAGRVAFEGWLCGCLWDVENTCPPPLQRELLEELADPLDLRVSADDALGLADRLEALVGEAAGDDVVICFARELLELALVLRGGARLEPPATEPAPLSDADRAEIERLRDEVEACAAPSILGSEQAWVEWQAVEFRWTEAAGMLAGRERPSDPSRARSVIDLLRVYRGFAGALARWADGENMAAVRALHAARAATLGRAIETLEALVAASLAGGGR